MLSDPASLFLRLLRRLLELLLPVLLNPSVLQLFDSALEAVDVVSAERSGGAEVGGGELYAEDDDDDCAP